MNGICTFLCCCCCCSCRCLSKAKWFQVLNLNCALAADILLYIVHFYVQLIGAVMQRVLLTDWRTKQHVHSICRLNRLNKGCLTAYKAATRCQRRQFCSPSFCDVFLLMCSDILGCFAAKMADSTVICNLWQYIFLLPF